LDACYRICGITDWITIFNSWWTDSTILEEAIVKTILSIFIFLSLLTARQSTAPEEKADPAKESLAVVTRLFEAMQAKDADGIRATFAPDGQLAVTQKRNGQTTVRLLTADAFAKSISEGKGVYRERMYKPEALVTGDLVTVRGRYGFYVDERFSHCGLNSFHLMRTQQGWKIVNAASTLEFDGCEPESKVKN
jgi:Domain of unknown function (DUF4440)